MNVLWDTVRPAYHRGIDYFGGARLRLGPVTTRVPAEYSGLGLDNYEPEVMTALTEWYSRYPAGVLIDVGSSYGLFVLATLTASERATVYAFDSDLHSLGAIRNLCKYQAGFDRVCRVLGFVTDNHCSGLFIDSASAATKELLIEGKIYSIQSIRYICLDAPPIEAIPAHSLDGLFAQAAQPPACLIKIDIEGAELLALRGADRLIREWRPTILVSVHPALVGQYGHSVEAVHDFLSTRGYIMKLLAIDHEEHWWCSPDTQIS